MLSVVCFKWKRNKRGFSLPAAIVEYSALYVNRLRNMVWRNLRIPHRFICVTDDPGGVDPRIEIVPLWDKCLNIGGCFNRLYTFSPDMEALFGPRFVCIDLDCVIVGDVTPLFTRTEDFIINSYKPVAGKNWHPQKYNGALYMMTAGARRQVWDTFDPELSPKIILENTAKVVGSDQAWVGLTLESEVTWTEADGVYEIRQLPSKADLPANAKIICFAGPRDPALENARWVKDLWK